MLKRGKAIEKENGLLEMAAEQFALLFWKQVTNKDSINIIRSLEKRRQQTKVITMLRK